MLLEQSTNIAASPAAVYGFFEAMEANYVRWHPDHIAFRWVEGTGLETGAIASFEERIAEEHQRKTVRFTEVVTDRYIEFEPTGRLTRLLMPSISFTIDPEGDGCVLTQRITVRTGPIGAWLNRREFDAVRRHMYEEGENLKGILEGERASTA